MKNVKVISIVLTIGLVAGLLYWAFGQAEEGTEVAWNVYGCEVDLKVPESIDLGEATPGEVLTSKPNHGEVKVTSTCSYTVTISLDGFTKDGSQVSGALLDTLLSQYSFRTESVSPADEVDNLQPTYITFSGVGDLKEVCGSNVQAEAPFKNHKCRLQFKVDTTLLPVGSYVASHTITASTP